MIVLFSYQPQSFNSLSKRTENMAPKRRKKNAIQPLDECIKALEKLPSFSSVQSPKQAASTYVSCLAFCHHLSIDQKIISEIRYVRVRVLLNWMPPRSFLSSHFQFSSVFSRQIIIENDISNKIKMAIRPSQKIRKYLP